MSIGPRMAEGLSAVVKPDGSTAHIHRKFDSSGDKLAGRGESFRD